MYIICGSIVGAPMFLRIGRWCKLEWIILAQIFPNTNVRFVQYFALLSINPIKAHGPHCLASCITLHYHHFLVLHSHRRWNVRPRRFMTGHLYYIWAWSDFASWGGMHFIPLDSWLLKTDEQQTGPVCALYSENSLSRVRSSRSFVNFSASYLLLGGWRHNARVDIVVVDGCGRMKINEYGNIYIQNLLGRIVSWWLGCGCMLGGLTVCWFRFPILPRTRSLYRCIWLTAGPWFWWSKWPCLRSVTPNKPSSPHSITLL
jgi:hypothetical protein